MPGIHATPCESLIKNVSKRLVRTIESRAPVTFFWEALFFLFLFFGEAFKKIEMEESDGDSSTQRATESDTAEGMEERAIRVMPIVTTLSFVRTVKDKSRGVRVTLTCYNC